MDIYIVLIENKPHNKVYRSLKDACMAAKIPYHKSKEAINDGRITQATVVMNKQRNTSNNKAIK
jgi:hypothetical protein